MKIRTMGAELFHVDGGTDGRKDTTKLTVNYRNFANAPKIVFFPFASSFTNCVIGVYIRGLFIYTREKVLSTGTKYS